MADRIPRAHLKLFPRSGHSIAADEPDSDMAVLLVRLGAAHFFNGDRAKAVERTEQALDIAQRYRLGGIDGIILSEARAREAGFPADDQVSRALIEAAA